MDGLEEKIRDIIERVYCCKYTRGIEVKKLEDNYYILKLFLHNPNFGALVIGAQCNSDIEFLAYVEKELNERKLTRSQQYKFIIYGNNDSEAWF